MEDVAKSRCWPASIRVVDNVQFKGAQALKEGFHSYLAQFIDGVKMFYVQTIRGFDLNQVAAVTMVFEGTRQEVETQKANIFRLCAKHNG